MMNRAPIRFALPGGLLLVLGVGTLVMACVTVTSTPPANPLDGSPVIESAPTPAPDPDPLPADALYVPKSIDSTGATDARPALQAFIDKAPNGSTIVFQKGGTYKLGSVIRLIGRKGLTLEGNGATLKLKGTASGLAKSGISIDRGSERITVRNLTIVGPHDAAGTGDACCSRETEHGIGVYGSFDTLIERVDVSRVGGDCFSGNWGPGDVWTDGLTIRDSTCRLTGRTGVGLPGAKRVRIVNNVFDELGFMVFNIEPSSGVGGASDVVIRGNTVGSYGLNDTWNSWFLAACGASGSVARDVTVTGNTIEGNRQGYQDQMVGLNVVVCGDDGRTRENFTVTNNTAGRAVAGPAMKFRSVKGVTVTGNEQPLSSGELAIFTGSTGVTYQE